MPFDSSTGQLASLAAELHQDSDEALTSRAIVARTIYLLPSAEHVSITLRSRRRQYRSLGASSDLTEQLDDLQYSLNEGPCLTALNQERWLRSGEVTHDHRWRAWAPHAGRPGIKTLLSVCLSAHDGAFAALNMYSTDAEGFSDPLEIEAAVLWASHAANALSRAQQVQGLEAAVTSRHTIGLAQGILMERYGLEEQQAFNLLGRLSSTRNEKLRDVAAEVIRTREVPEAVPRTD